MRIFTLALATGCAILTAGGSAALVANDFKLLDVRTGSQRFTGRVMAHNDETCWFLQRDGRLQQFAMEKVTEFKEIDDRFRANSQLELKTRLQAEFGRGFDVRTAGHYIVVARPGTAESYAALFDRIYREFVRSFATRGLEISQPEFPLIAIVFPNQATFLKYCEQEGTPKQSGVVGYYLRTSNRVALFERPDETEVDQTVIHEATHQVAFNTGVHNRLGDHPKWVVEGLATLFESDGIRIRPQMSAAAERVNRERFLWFQEFVSKRRPEHSLASFIRHDEMFATSALDAYSQAWALSFYLFETRPVQYAKYLKRLNSRDPLESYGEVARLRDFTEAFGSDLGTIEQSFLIYLRRIGK